MSHVNEANISSLRAGVERESVARTVSSSGEGSSDVSTVASSTDIGDRTLVPRACVISHGEGCCTHRSKIWVPRITCFFSVSRVDVAEDIGTHTYAHTDTDVMTHHARTHTHTKPIAANTVFFVGSLEFANCVQSDRYRFTNYFKFLKDTGKRSKMCDRGKSGQSSKRKKEEEERRSEGEQRK